MNNDFMRGWKSNLYLNNAVFNQSKWKRGVGEYAIELFENLDNLDSVPDSKTARETLLNGASSWTEYSHGGCSLIYDGDIAERLCTPSELKRTRNGERQPNSNETWLDVQARALYQANNRIMRAYHQTVRDIKNGVHY